MPGYVICPHCGATVKPLVGADGKNLCPQCRNQGRPGRAYPAPTMPPPAPSPGPAFEAVAPQQPLPNAPGAVASLVLGIASIVLALFAIILAPLAIVFGAKALKRAKTGQYGGQGLAVGGIVTGIIGILIGITVVLAAVVFVLVANLAEPSQPISFLADEDSNALLVTSADEGLLWSDFSVAGTAACTLPTGIVDEGDVVQCDQSGTVVIRDEDGAEVYAGEV